MTAAAPDDLALLDAYSQAVMATLERTRGGVVSLAVRGPEATGRRGRTPRESAGSGFIVTPDGYLLTNSHVADAGKHVSVTLDDGSTHGAEKVGSDVDTDLALLRIASSLLRGAQRMALDLVPVARRL